MPATYLDDPSEELVARAARYLSEYLRDHRTRTDLLVDVAELVVELRRRSTLADGRTDWSGRGAAYRRLISPLYARAGVPEDQRAAVQQAISYHVLNRLHAVAPAEELVAANLSPRSPKQRHQGQRAVMRALRDEVGEEGLRDPLRLVTYAYHLLNSVRVPDILASDENVRRAFSEQAAALAKSALALGGVAYSESEVWF